MMWKERRNKGMQKRRKEGESSNKDVEGKKEERKECRKVGRNKWQSINWVWEDRRKENKEVRTKAAKKTKQKNRCYSVRNGSGKWAGMARRPRVLPRRRNETSRCVSASV